MDEDKVTTVVVKDGRGRIISEDRKLRLFALAEYICSGEHTQAEALKKAGFNEDNRHLLSTPAYLHVQRVVTMSYHMNTAQHRREVIGLTLDIAWDMDNVQPKDRLKALEMMGRWSGLEPQELAPEAPQAKKRQQSDEVLEILAEVLPAE